MKMLSIGPFRNLFRVKTSPDNSFHLFVVPKNDGKHLVQDTYRFIPGQLDCSLEQFDTCS